MTLTQIWGTEFIALKDGLTTHDNKNNHHVWMNKPVYEPNPPPNTYTHRTRKQTRVAPMWLGRSTENNAVVKHKLAASTPAMTPNPRGFKCVYVCALRKMMNSRPRWGHIQDSIVPVCQLLLLSLFVSLPPFHHLLLYLLTGVPTQAHKKSRKWVAPSGMLR